MQEPQGRNFLFELSPPGGIWRGDPEYSSPLNSVYHQGFITHLFVFNNLYQLYDFSPVVTRFLFVFQHIYFYMSKRKKL